jgi:hypothetical protein
MQIFTWLLNALLQVMTPATTFDFFAAVATVMCFLGIIGFFFFLNLKRHMIPSSSKKKRVLPELEEWQQPSTSIEMRARESEGADAVV